MSMKKLIMKRVVQNGWQDADVFKRDVSQVGIMGVKLYGASAWSKRAVETRC
jgi:hypothetical protein